MTTFEQFALFILGLFSGYLAKYFTKKGENLATKEDIEAITSKIESVKYDYANQLEQSKTEMNAQLKNHGFRYEKEFEILLELSSLLVETRDACLSLRPMLDRVDPNVSEDKRKKERLNRFYKARHILYLARETKQPFFPQDIYDSIVAVEKTAHKESLRYQHRDPDDFGKNYDYWEDADELQKEIVSQANEAIFKIRERVKSWESVENGL